MVCDSNGNISDTIHLPNIASKGHYSGRIIPLHKRLKEELIELKTSLSLSDFAEGHIITTERSSRCSAQTIVNFFQTLYKTIGFEGCSSHSGRRTFITTAAKFIGQTGGTLNDVKILAGHSSLSTTQRYIEYNTDAQKRIIDRI